ncbi:MAG: hypothetical protein QOI51_1750 [Nocardioidaceae bacterium]|nr:hypothetical protein [Nocardioidaceae bacterium]
MILRGIAARRLLALTVFLLTALVVAGTVVALGFSRVTHVSTGSVYALVLLGLIAVAAQSVESVHRREHDLALARLRGRSGVRLLFFAVAEPSAVTLAGAAAGLAVGWLLARAIIASWLPTGTTFRLTTHEWEGVGVVTLANLAVVVACSWRTMRTPLFEQLARTRRPRAASTVGVFLQALLVLGAVVAVYQAHESARTRVDWVTLVSPAVIGLAAGQVLIWLLVASLAALVRRRPAAGLGWFITVRRLLRRADSLALLRMVVAAGVVFAVAASASTAARSSREERARLQVGAPVSYPVPGGALRAYAAADKADPGGSWLLPVAAYTTDSEVGSRRVFVAADRWKDVVGDFFQGTATGPLTRVLNAFPPTRASVYRRGDSVAATVTTASLRHAVGLLLTFQYINDSGDLAVVNLPLRPDRGTPAGPGVTVFTRSLPHCRLGCSIVELDISGYNRVPLQVANVSFSGEQLLTASAGFRLAHRLRDLRAQMGSHGLRVLLPKAPFGLGNGDRRVLGRFQRSAPEAAVSTHRNPLAKVEGQPAVAGIDGALRPVRVVATVPVLPFVGTKGTVLDLAPALLGAGGSIPGTQAAILARADTPDHVIAALRATGSVGRPTTYEEALRRLEASARAQGTRLYILVAVFAALIVVLSVVSSVSQQRHQRRQEAASLRSVGVPVAQITGAYRRETFLLAVASGVGTCLASWVACRVLLHALPLVSGWAYGPRPDTSPQLGLIAATALVVGVTVAAVVYVALRRVGRSAPPRLLREEPS